ncbi:MAG: histidine phosphatase family protein [Verrucomicrobiales bacterium]|jgi:phosphohistidine phosphatase|nr:histidine phosphatase family protein [Verrucomicrobiales bacterium]MBP9222387.1 histidine phosphatase family protein [Verrucomicrobiales bacterium]
MKQLLLIRHGKSDWDSPGLNDHERTLNEQGQRDVLKMAAALRQRGVEPDLIVTSTAIRALTTARMIGDAMACPIGQIQADSDLYLASPQTILRKIQHLDEDADTVMIFGHNPGMHEAVNLLSDSTVVEDFPTLAVARFELSVGYWGEIEFSTGLLIERITPRFLSSE